MSLIFMIFGFFILKGLLVWPFYTSLKGRPLLVGFFLALAEAPFLTLLYHETEVNFWIPFFAFLVFDATVYLFLLKKVLWKAIVVSILLNFIGFIFFIIVNG